MCVGSVNSLEELQVELDNDVGRARTVSALSVRGISANKLGQRSVGNVFLHLFQTVIF